MTQNKLIKPIPVQKGDTIQVKGLFFEVLKLEKLYYKFQNLSSGSDAGFTSQIYNVTALIPSPKFIYHITGFGINGDIEAQLRYQSGTPRNTPVQKPTQRLTQEQAHYLDPFENEFNIVSSDSLDIDISVPFDDIKAEVWFYGWKLTVNPITTPKKQPIVLEDMN